MTSVLVGFIMCLILGLLIGFSEGYSYRILEEARKEAKEAQEHLDNFLKSQK